ncbi:MAG: chloride channel protein [Actinomycetota bacterium]
MAVPYAKDPAFWARIADAVVIGGAAGIFTLLYLGVEHFLTNAIWGHDALSVGWFSGDWRTFAVPAVGGIVIGILYMVLKAPARFDGFIHELEEGYVEPTVAWKAVVIGLTSLVSGASVGPEGPLASGAGGMATWYTRGRGADEDRIRSGMFSSVSSVFGGLLSSPFTASLMTLELAHTQNLGFVFSTVIPSLVAGIVGFVIIYPVLGEVFVGLYTFESFDLKMIYFLVAVAIGVVSAAAALLFGISAKLMNRAFAPLAGRPIIRGAIGGILAGTIFFAMPVTMFSGIGGLEVLIETAGDVAIWALLLIVVLKMIALSSALASGFYGGPFFPLFFIGGTLGVALHVLFPDLPLGLAVGAAMGGVAGALASIPLSIMVFAAFVVGFGVSTIALIGTAVVTAFTITYGLGFIGAGRDENPDTGSLDADADSSS